MTLPPDFTLLQVVPELDTGGAEQTTIDIAHAVVRRGGKALVATRGGRMAARLESDGGRLAQMPVQTKNPLVMLGNAARLVDLIHREGVSLVHARSRAPAFSALWAAQVTGTPFVATYHGVYNARSRLKRWYNAVMTRGDL
ncbi:MAG: glycosyltransferase, partial [Phenylobacterium sp.]|nr:glycosyltransferase [Phenylobacterium sp.]